MIVVRRIRKQGGSNLIALPPDWIKSVMMRTGQVPNQVKMNVNDNIVVEPLPRDVSQDKSGF